MESNIVVFINAINTDDSFIQVMRSMERLSRGWALTFTARFRGHHIKLVGTRFKKGKNEMFADSTSNRPLGKLCQRSGR